MCDYPGCHRSPVGSTSKCFFHLPAESELKPPPHELNREAREDMKRGEYDFDGCIFNGKQDFSKLGFSVDTSFSLAHFLGDVDFSGSSFGKYTNFSQARFEGFVDLSNVTFMDNVSFANASFAEQGSAKSKRYNAIVVKHANFQKKANFTGAEFGGGNAIFQATRFNGIEANFSNCKFHGRITFFRDCHFDGNCFFVGAQFSGAEASFTKSEFRGDIVSFHAAQFTNDVTSFTQTQFMGGEVRFVLARFTGERAHFSRAEFSCQSVAFDGAAFVGGEVLFAETRFSCDITFCSIEIGSDISFDAVRLGEKSQFQFESANFVRSRENAPRLLFRRIRFNPLQTFFDNVRSGNQFLDSNVSERPILLFRQCQLKDVFFSNNEMMLFSFFSSVFFEESHLFSNQWIERPERLAGFIPFRSIRRTQIVEEEMLEQLKAVGGDIFKSCG